MKRIKRNRSKIWINQEGLKLLKVRRMSQRKIFRNKDHLNQMLHLQKVQNHKKAANNLQEALKFFKNLLN